jgi:hypothetical protein
MQNVVTTLNVVVMLSAVGPVGIVLPSKSTISQVCQARITFALADVDFINCELRL